MRVLLKDAWGPIAWVAFAAPMVEAIGILSLGPPSSYPPSPTHAVAAGSVSLVAVLGIAFGARRDLRYAGAGLLLVGAAHLADLLTSVGPRLEITQTLVHGLMLFGLTGLVLAVEQRSRDLFTQVFIRLNLAFIFLAGVLMVFASEAERAKQMNFAQRGLTELAEVVRGSAMFYLNDQPPREVLDSPVLFRRIVADFGEHPDLRVARIRLDNQELVVSIDSDGMIDRRIVSAPRAAEQAANPLSPTVIVGEWPIFRSTGSIGAVVLEQTRESITREMAGPILVIFFAFTSMVTVASVLIGAIVYGASEQLRNQVEQIERSERLLMQAAKLASLGELVSGVAHEINNPLTVMLSRMDYLRDLNADGGVPSEVTESIEVVRRHMNRIRKIVQDLLSFARPHPIERRWMELHDVVRRSTELIGLRLRTAGVSLRIDLPPDLPQLHADADRLEQVLINLVNNAVDAMPGGGALRISARQQGRDVVLAVSDTGVGIAEEDLKKVFDPFFSTKKGKGTGLGLSISHRIVRDHGGQLWAESQPGRGSTFFISLSPEVRHD
jgi:signal transduction histidine kinase